REDHAEEPDGQSDGAQVRLLEEEVDVRGDDGEGGEREHPAHARRAYGVTSGVEHEALRAAPPVAARHLFRTEHPGDERARHRRDPRCDVWQTDVDGSEETA